MAVPMRIVKGTGEGDIDQFNQWMRSQPWYAQMLQQWGQNPSSVHLSDDQRHQLMKAAQANGAQVDEGNIEVDPSGNLNPIGHKLRNTLIGLGVGGAALAAPFALGALAGGGGAAGGAASGTAAGAGIGGASAVPALAAGIPEAIGGASALGGAAAVPALAAGIPSAIGGASALPLAAAAAPTSLLGKLKNFATSDAGVDMLGNAARSAADANASRDKLLPGMAATQLAQDKFALDAPGTRLGQSTRAAALANMTPSTTSWAGPGSGARGVVPTMTGGATADIPKVSSAVQPLSNEILRKNLQDQLAGRDSQNKYLDQFGKSSVGDKMLGWASTGTGILNGLKKAKVF